jgi:sugar-specific transcriptional regulator TrmB
VDKEESASSSPQEIESALKENFKLSSYEARIYISLMRLGLQNTKQLSTSATIPLPRVYDSLESLMAKGFAIKKDDGFLAIPAKQALKGRTRQFEVQFAEEQQRRAEAENHLTDLFELTSIQKPGSHGASEISILKGFNSIANKFAELLEDSSEVFLIAKRAIEAKEFFIPILLEFASHGNKRIRIIAPNSTKITKKDLERAKDSGAEIRKSDNVIFDMMITDHDDVMIGVPDPLSEEINHAIAIWVRNPSFAKSTWKSVEEMWQLARQ